MAEALYRKYRPQIFEDMVGQEHIERTLKNAVEQDKVSHAYLFCGPRGTGKTTTARLLAKALLCEDGPTPEPDGTCENCLAIANGTHPDVYELDAASRTGVDNVREEIIGRVHFAPTSGRYKIYIIDEVHMLSTAAFNALLKTLEEPPSHVVFILCTTDPQKVPETIHSRCQRFDFRRISAEAMVSRLGAICVEEGVEFEGDALDLIAHRADGGLRNALTSLEQLIAFGEGKVTLDLAEKLLGSLDSSDMAEIVTAIGKRDIAGCFVWTDNYIESGADLAQFTRDLAEHIRNMYVLTLSGNDTPLEVSETTRKELTKEMELYGPDRLARMLGVLGDLSAELRTSTNPRLSFEIALTRMVRPDSDLTLASLAERVEALESGYSAVSHVSAAPMAASQPTAASVSQSAVPTASAQVQPAQGASQPAMQPGLEVPQAATQSNTQVAQTQQPVQQPVQQPAAQPIRQTAQVPQAVQAQPQPQAVSAAGAAQVAPAAQAQPAPTAQVAASAQAVSGLSNPAALQRIWKAALEALAKEKAAYGALFLNTHASYDEAAKELVVEFPAENTFAFSAVQKPDAIESMKKALLRAIGSPLPFRYTQGKAASAGTPAASAPMPTVAASAQPATSAAQPAVQAGPQYEARQAQAPQSAPATTQAAQQASATPAAPMQSAGAPAGFAAPEPEEIPLDVYESVPLSSYDDVPPTSMDAAPLTGSSPSRPETAPQTAAPMPQASAATQVPQTAVFVPQSATQVPQAAAPAPGQAAEASCGASSPGSDDVEAIESLLAATGFGEGIVFEEIDEE